MIVGSPSLERSNARYLLSAPRTAIDQRSSRLGRREGGVVVRSLGRDAERGHDPLPLLAVRSRLPSKPMIDDEVGVLMEKSLADALLGGEEQGAEADAVLHRVGASRSNRIALPLDRWRRRQWEDGVRMAKGALGGGALRYRRRCSRRLCVRVRAPRPGVHGWDYDSPGEAQERVRTGWSALPSPTRRFG